MNRSVIVSAVRTAIGNFNGSLRPVPATALGSAVIKEALQRSRVPAGEVQEVILGNVIQAGLGQNPARQAALGAELPVNISATTINKVCGSGLQSVILADRAIRAGDVDVVVAGGMENMSRAPYLLNEARFGQRLGDGKLVDAMVQDGLWDAKHNHHMGNNAEILAEKFRITRLEQEEFTVRSQQKCGAATAAGRFRDEILPIAVSLLKGDPVVFDRDEFPKPGTTVAKLARLKPSFKPDGTVTAATASGINDGAAALVVMSAAKATQIGLQPLAEIVASGSAGLESSLMGLGPVEATRAALTRAGLRLDEIDLIELNEAFAVQAMAVSRELGWDEARMNVNGGAIALGHPIGASGARILVTLLHEMRRRGARYGLATICIGGGEGLALIVKRV